MQIDISTLLSIGASVLAFAIAAIYYHLNSVSKINLLEAEIKDVSHRLTSLESRVESALQNLSDKLDKLVYTIAGKNLQS